MGHHYSLLYDFLYIPKLVGKFFLFSPVTNLMEAFFDKFVNVAAKTILAIAKELPSSMSQYLSLKKQKRENNNKLKRCPSFSFYLQRSFQIGENYLGN
jgi:hypothetical protein